VSEVTHQCSYNRFLHVVIIINFLVCKNEMRLGAFFIIAKSAWLTHNLIVDHSFDHRAVKVESIIIIFNVFVCVCVIWFFDGEQKQTKGIVIVVRSLLRSSSGERFRAWQHFYNVPRPLILPGLIRLGGGGNLKSSKVKSCAFLLFFHHIVRGGLFFCFGRAMGMGGNGHLALNREPLTKST